MGDEKIPLTTTCLERDLLSTSEVRDRRKAPAEIHRGKVTEWKFAESVSHHLYRDVENLELDDAAGRLCIHHVADLVAEEGLSDGRGARNFTGAEIRFAF